MTDEQLAEASCTTDPARAAAVLTGEGIVTARKVAPRHPGEVLRKEFMKPLKAVFKKLNAADEAETARRALVG
jgi:hypothetical protein